MNDNEFEQQFAEGETPPASNAGAAISERRDQITAQGDEFSQAFEADATQEAK